MQLFAPTYGQFDFGFTVLEIDGQRDEGKAFDLGFLGELLDLGLMQEQLALPLGFVVVYVALLVCFDVAIYQGDFALIGDGEATVEGNVVLPDGFDFRAFQDNTRLNGFEDFVLEAGLAVLTDYLNAHFATR